VRLQLVNTELVKLLPGVAGGGMDLALFAMTDTPEREKSADFVNFFSFRALSSAATGGQFLANVPNAPIVEVEAQVMNHALSTAARELPVRNARKGFIVRLVRRNHPNGRVCAPEG
jgi:hypothetical protein